MASDKPFALTDIYAKAQRPADYQLTVPEHYILVHQMLDEIIQTGSRLIEKALKAKAGLDVSHDNAAEHPYPSYRMTRHEARLLEVRAEFENVRRDAPLVLKERLRMLESVLKLKYIPDEAEPDKGEKKSRKKRKS